MGTGFIISGDSVIGYDGKETILEIPVGVTKINAEAFEGLKKVKKVRLPEGITEIGYHAFKGCSSLEEINIPESVVKIESAFANCTKLKCLEIPNPEATAFSAIEGCKSMEYVKASELTIDTVFRFASPAQKARLCYHYLCGSDNNVEYDNTAKRMKKKLLPLIIEDDNVAALIRFFELYKKIITINELDEYLEMFEGKSNLVAFVMNYKNKHYSTQNIEKNASENIEKELGIKERTVAEWRKIFGLSISKDRVVISAYKGNDAVVEIPAMIGNKPVTELQAYLFENNDNIETVILPNTLDYISWFAFSNSSIETITIPVSVTTIGMNAFYNCMKLSKVNFDGDAERKIQIEDDAFENCPNLIFVAETGGVVDQFAKEHGISFESK